MGSSGTICLQVWHGYDGSRTMGNRGGVKWGGGRGDGVEELSRCRVHCVVKEGVPPWCSLDTPGGGVDGSFSLTVCDVAHPIQATGGQIVTEHLEDVGW